jgi:hypothetical protein
MVLAFLAGADLGLNVFRAKWKESTAVGLVGFFSSTGGAVVRLSAPAGFGRCSCADSSKNEDRVRAPQAGLENVKCEPGSMFTSARQRWSNRRNFSGGRKQRA